jgi:hypothetical protein
MASKYITVGASALILSIFVAFAFQISSLSARNDKLTAQLANSKLQSTMQTNVIAQYSIEVEYMNTLLTERKAASIKQERVLNETIQTIKKSIGDVSCVIPESVTNELRSEY